MSAVTEGTAALLPMRSADGTGTAVGPGIGQLTNVLICWRCAYEEPPLYGRTALERSPRGVKTRGKSYLPGDWMPGKRALGRRPW